jgi:5'-methylthioadenosine phosphorylase
MRQASGGQAKAVQLGVIGGSGIYQMDGVRHVRHHDLTTPFGTPADPIIAG